MWNHAAASRHGPTVLAVLALIGISIFIAYFIIAFPNGGGRHYEYSCPLAAMWTGIGTLWFSISFLAWWALSRNLTTRSLDSQQGLWTLYVWSLYSILFAVEGFVAMIGWAQAKNEAVTSGLSVLWVLAGGLAASMMADLIRVKRRIVVASTHATLPDVEDGTTFEDEQDKAQTKKGRCSRCSCCCTKRFWVDFVFLFLTTFLLIFSTGFMMQGISSASDANMIPPGTIYSFPLTMNDGSIINFHNFQMHLYCMGEKNLTNDSPTVILEHGGGANSITMLALAQELETKYQTRTCVYDRLGYGYTSSYYTNDDGRLPNTGVILAQLLQVAGEQGPFVCAGHSAGGEFCLWFALASNVTGVALMDGYPDIIRPGSFRPGIPLKGSDGPLGSIQSLAVMAGGTGLTRGLVGDPGPNFVPFASRQTVKSLYGQARFWFSQYWDVRSDVEMEESSRLYQQLNGTIGNNGLVTYGRTLSGTKVLVLPAESTVAALDCDGKDSGSYCCGSAKDSTICEDQELDRSIFQAQNDLYASTLGSNGLVIQAPAGSEHGFVNHKDYYQWAASQIGEQLLQ